MNEITLWRRWLIEITTDRPDPECWATDPSGEQFKIFVPPGQHIVDTRIMAHAFINRQIRLDQEETTCQPS